MDWYRLRVIKVKDSIIFKVMKAFDSYQDIFKLTRDQLQKYFSLDNITLDQIYQSKEVNLEKELKILSKEGISIISLKDKAYPLSLKNIASPPVFLYYKGDINLASEDKIIGIVGTRRPSRYGIRGCESITKDLIDSNIITVSGLALGIDTVCHKVSLNNNGKTIGVVGSGLNICYPQENKYYWEEISKKGLLLSEYPLDTPGLPHHFPLRNRIIAGLARGIIVIESKEKGGSLITANLALEEGRDVFALPGEIYSPTSLGTNELIKNSEAKLITSGVDVLKEFDWEVKNKEKVNLNLTPEERIIYNNLVQEKNLDELIIITSLKPKILLAILMDMEINGYIKSINGGKYIRKSDNE